MKVYRIIGTVFSVLLAIIFALEIFALVFLHGAALAVNKQTIADITNAFLDNEELYGSMTENLSQSVSANITDKIFTSAIGENNEIQDAVADAINEVLNTEEFKDVISDITSDYLMDMLEPDTASTTPDVAEKLSSMFEENPETFDTIIEDMATESGITYDDVYTIASGYAKDAGFAMPEYGTSYSEMIASVIASDNEMLTGILNEYLAAAGLPTVGQADEDAPDIDYAPIDSEADAEAAITEMQELMATVSKVLDFLKSPVYIAIMCGSFLIFFGICALLTWSVRRSLLISGIMTAFYGILLLFTSALEIPTDWIIALIGDAFGTATTTACSIITVAWSAACEKILLCGVLSVVLAVLLIGGSILWTVLLRKKKSAIS